MQTFVSQGAALVLQGQTILLHISAMRGGSGIIPLSALRAVSQSVATSDTLTADTLVFAPPQSPGQWPQNVLRRSGRASTDSLSRACSETQVDSQVAFAKLRQTDSANTDSQSRPLGSDTVDTVSEVSTSSKRLSKTQTIESWEAQSLNSGKQTPAVAREAQHLANRSAAAKAFHISPEDAQAYFDQTRSRQEDEERVEDEEAGVADPKPKPKPKAKGKADPKPEPAPKAKGKADPRQKPAPKAKGKADRKPKPAPKAKGKAAPKPKPPPEAIVKAKAKPKPTAKAKGNAPQDEEEEQEEQSEEEEERVEDQECGDSEEGEEEEERLEDEDCKDDESDGKPDEDHAQLPRGVAWLDAAPKQKPAPKAKGKADPKPKPAPKAKGKAPPKPKPPPKAIVETNAKLKPQEGEESEEEEGGVRAAPVGFEAAGDNRVPRC